MASNSDSPTARSSPDKKKRAYGGPIETLWTEHIQSWIAIAVAIISLAGSLFFVYRTYSLSLHEMRVVVIDPANNMYVSPVEFARGHSPLVQRMALLAAQAFYQRNPSGLALPEMAQAIFLDRPLAALMNEVKFNEEEMRSRSLRVVPEIHRIQALRETPDGVRIVDVRGNLILSGSFQGIPLIENQPFHIIFGFIDNPNLGQAGEFPLVVSYFTIRDLPQQN